MAARPAEQLLDAASGIGERLIDLAIRGDDGGASWIGLSLGSRGRWSLRPLGLDLYDGRPGVALFLAQLGRLTGQERFTELAHGATMNWQRELTRTAESVTGIGGFSGWGGAIYALAHFGALWHDRGLLDQAEQIVVRLPALIAQDEALDLMGGAAGCVGGLAALYRVSRSASTLAAAVRCGERLVERAEAIARPPGWPGPQTGGLGWPTPQTDGRALAGFAHGAAGIAWALLQLDELLGEPRFRPTALAGLAYERSLFSPEAANWLDLREGTAERPSFMTAWCHGAPGIGLARLGTLHALDSLDDAAARAEIAVALNTTAATRPGADHSLCHGGLGSLELLLEAGRVLDPDWTVRAVRLAGPILADAERAGWRCGTPLGVESPGLMTGLAGIGYGLLRLASPDEVPSVLSLEPPRSAWPVVCPP
jgi:type 2 lantibiotic biosynthesis protein LanM